MDITPKIRLEKYKWNSNGIISVVGFVWLNSEYISEEAFLKLLSGYSGSFESVKKLVAQLNGQFSFVIKKQQEVWAACSHTWSYPLFFRKNKREYFLSDDPKKLKTAEDRFTQDVFAQLYFLNFGVTPLNRTLAKEVFQLQAGEIVRFSETDSESFTFGLYSEEQGAPQIQVAEEDKLYDFLAGAFDKYYRVLKNRQVLLPLTRGYDSRLLACLLKEFGHNNVVCVTWGRTQNSELETARKVAKELGYRHVFMNYSQGIAENFISSPDFFEYINYAGHWSSMPFLSEYFGLKELKREGVIDPDVVALPGHPGDFLRGEHLDREMETADTDYLVAKIIAQFNSTYPLAKNEQKKITDFVGNTFFSGKEGAFWRGHEQWDYQERQCKFIGNSAQVFAYWEMDFMMPLFDLELLRFFAKIPFGQKVGQNVYNSTLEKYFFKKLGVGFDLKTTAAPKQIYHSAWIKKMLLRLAPRQLKSCYYKMNDDIYYREITRELRTYDKTFHYKHPLRPNAYNSYLIQWYQQFVTQLL